jgi:UDP-2,3-diacylglucosamine pyrophosphatase LpxH
MPTDNYQDRGLPREPRQYRALFISDLHLGTRACQADAFLDFLRYHEADTIYLAGDIVDFWSLKRSPLLWLQSHNDILQKLLRKARKGTRIVFVPGNHDEAVRGYCGMHFGAIEIHHDIVHVAASGERFLVIHGDEFDVVVRYARWLALLGDRSYEFALWCNGPLNLIRRRLGFGFWSFAGYLKMRVKSAVNFIGEFEQAIAAEAKRRGASGVICGHIHHMTDRTIEGIRYINCGDWVESCTAIAEDHDGVFHQIRWQPGPAIPAPALAAPVPLPIFGTLPAGVLARGGQEADWAAAGSKPMADAAAQACKDMAIAE